MLSAEVMRAQVRSTVVDLLMLTGLTYDEARARVPASAALDDHDAGSSTWTTTTPVPTLEDHDAGSRPGRPRCRSCVALRRGAGGVGPPARVPELATMTTAPAPLRTHAPATGLPPVPLLALALLAVTANLRVAMSSLPPLRDTIVADLHLSNAAMGALTTLPVLCMGLFAPAAQRLARRFGAAAGVQLAVLIVLVGVGSRLWGDTTWVLYAGTFLAGVGIAIGGTLLPGLVKALFPPHRTGLVTGLYMLAMMGGAAASSALSVPLADRLGSWQGSLASWSLLAAVGALAWAPGHRGLGAAPRGQPGGRLRTRPPLAAPHRVARRRVHGPAVVAVLLVPGVGGAVLPGPRLGRDHHRLPAVGVQRGPGVLGAARPAPRRPGPRPAGAPAVGVGFGAAGLLGLAVAPGAAPWLWVALLGMGQGPAFSLGMVLLIDYSAHAAGQRSAGGDGAVRQLHRGRVGPDDHGRGAGRHRQLPRGVGVLLGLAVVQTLLVTRFRRCAAADALTARSGPEPHTRLARVAVGTGPRLDGPDVRAGEAPGAPRGPARGRTAGRPRRG